ncbi:hypothetical protein [Clostridium sp. DJ247]|nr:hypothetical protein [Clostridium sp. DJ247]MBC2579582.1 hypothetical protein [Clostridium sp. DJ247]
MLKGYITNCRVSDIKKILQNKENREINIVMTKKFYVFYYVVYEIL